jgi:hypothetical protein
VEKVFPCGERGEREEEARILELIFINLCLFRLLTN